MSDVRIRGDLTVLRVLLPVPDGVPLDEAVKALAAIVPADPDADLIERMAEVMHREDHAPLRWSDAPSHIANQYRRGAVLALRVVRESEAGA